MTLPVSSYEELLIQVRELTHETILLQRQLSFDLFDNADPPDVNQNFSCGQKNYEKGEERIACPALTVQREPPVLRTGVCNLSVRLA